MHTKFERLLSKSLTTLEVVTYYLVVHTGPDLDNCRVRGKGEGRVEVEVKCTHSKPVLDLTLCFDNYTCRHTDKEDADLAVSPSHSIPTPG